jgi:hypothetical protein
VGLERTPLSLVSTTEELLDRKVAALVYKTESTAVGIRHADHLAPSICKSLQSLRRQAAVARSVLFAHGLRPESFFYIYSSYMYNTYIRPLLVQARTADYALSRVVQVEHKFNHLNCHMPDHLQVEILYFLCRASPCPILRTSVFS